MKAITQQGDQDSTHKHDRNDYVVLQGPLPMKWKVGVLISNLHWTMVNRYKHMFSVEVIQHCPSQLKILYSATHTSPYIAFVYLAASTRYRMLGVAALLHW